MEGLWDDYSNVGGGNHVGMALKKSWVSKQFLKNVYLFIFGCTGS